MGKGSSNWISKQKADKYYRKSKLEGHRARSYYKLEQIEKKYYILKQTQRFAPRILDLGAAPGAWLEYIKDVVNKTWDPSKIASNHIIGIDLNTVRPFPDAEYISSYRMNIFQGKCLRFLQEQKKFDIILSDLAPKTAGDSRDIAIINSMVQKVFEFLQFLNPGGNVVCKIFQSDETYGLSKMFESQFQSFKQMKPEASKKQSREIYFIGISYKK